MPKIPKPTPAELRLPPFEVGIVPVFVYRHPTTRKRYSIVLDGKGRETTVDGYAQVPLPDDDSPLGPKLHEGAKLGQILRHAAAVVVKFADKIPMLLGIQVPAKVLTALRIATADVTDEEKLSMAIYQLGSERLQKVHAAYLARVADGTISQQDALEIAAVAAGVRL